MANAKKLPSAGTPPADKLYSSYWWIMELDPNHIRNNPNVVEIHGYSKMQGHDEMRDKEFLFMKKIHMLVTNGYTERTRKIEIFYRRGDIVNKSSDPKIVTLRPKFFVLEPAFMKPKYFEWQTFLTKLYGELKEGKSIANLLPQRKSNFSKDDYMDVDKLFFNNEGQLNTYCSQLIRNGHSFEAAMAFQRKYLEKKPFK